MKGNTHLVNLAVEATRCNEAGEFAIDKGHGDAKGGRHAVERHAAVRLQQLRVCLDAHLADVKARVLSKDAVDYQQRLNLARKSKVDVCCCGFEVVSFTAIRFRYKYHPPLTSARLLKKSS